MARVLALLCAAVLATALSASAAAAVRAAPEPVPSLTPAKTATLWRQLVSKRGRHRFATAACSPARIVFYAPTDWMRLATRLAANPSPCAQYYVGVPPLANDKTVLRAGFASQIRALGPNFHALAEMSVTGWTAWVASTGAGWYAAGVEARRRMAAAGFDVAAGDTWSLNELSTAVRAGTGNARANMRAFLNGLHDGDAGPAARGVVFTAGIAQTTGDLSVYQSRLQEWYEDSAFWTDVARATSDWSQEVYGDVRAYAAPGETRDARRDALNEYLQHPTALAAAAPAAGAVQVRNRAGQASRVLLTARLPEQVELVAIETNRGRCSPAGQTVACELDYLAGDLVATVRLHTVVRRAGTLAFGAATIAEPADAEPGNDVAELTTTVAEPPQLVATAPNLAPALRLVRARRVVRLAGVATVRVRFTVSEPAALEARLTPRTSSRPLTLLRATTLAGARTTAARTLVQAAAARAGSYEIVARVASAKLVRGRAYALRLAARDAGGKSTTLVVRLVG